MFTKVSSMHKISGFEEDKLLAMSSYEVQIFKNTYYTFQSSWLINIIDTFKAYNKHADLTDFLKKELDWRESVRESTIKTKFDLVTSWGVIPSLSKKTNWKIKPNRLNRLGTYIAHIMFWHIGIGINGNWFTIIRPDSNTEDSGSLIKIRLDYQDIIEIKSIARDKLIFDTKTNIRNITHLYKVIEEILKKEDWLETTSNDKSIN